MKASRIALLALACFLPLAASAQWQWLDSSGRKVFSDKAPPPDVAPERVLKRPGPRGGRSVDVAPVATAQPAAAAASLPKPSGKDKALEEKKKQIEAAEAEKKKAEEQKVAEQRADNCKRAHASKANYDSGMRVARTNDKGEREILTDEQRAEDVRRLNEVIARDCK